MRTYLEEAKDENSDGINHLNKTIKFLEEWYAATTEELTQLLSHGEITYDLLWALFKPGATVYTMDQECEQPRCFLYDFGDPVKHPTAGNYFEMVCRSLHYDGKFFG